MRQLLSFLVVIICCTAANAQLVKDSAWSIRQVTPNVYVFETIGTLNDIVHGNCTVIDGGSELMIVDNFNDLYLTAKALDEIKRRSNKPIKYIVNTHWHYDHVMGNYLMKQRFPSAMIIAHNFTARELSNRVEGYVKNLPGRLIRGIGRYDTAIQTGKANDSVFLSEYERAVRYPRSIKQYKTHLGHMNDDYRYIPVDLSFTDSMKILLGNEEVILSQPGSANTKGDIIVYLPSQKILLTGDIVVYPIPYAFGADQFAWIDVLQRLKDMDVSIYIPGHGNTLYNKNYIQTLVDVFSELNKQAGSAMNRGLNAEQAKKEIKLPEWEQKMAGNDEERKWAFHNYFVQPAIQSIYNNRKK